jgi:hypothetical protein
MTQTLGVLQIMEGVEGQKVARPARGQIVSSVIKKRSPQ